MTPTKQNMISNTPSVASELLKKAIYFLYYKKRFIKYSVVVTLCVATLLYFFSPRIYLTTFSVLVRVSDMDTSRVLPNTGVYVQPEAVNQEVLNSEQALLLSDKVLAATLKKTYEQHPDFSLSALSYAPNGIGAVVSLFGDVLALLPQSDITPEQKMQDEVEALRKLLTITPVVGTRIIEVECAFYNQQQLYDLQMNLLEAYLTTRGTLLVNNTATEIYTNDAQKYKKEWEQLLEKTAQFRAETKVYDLVAQREALISRLVTFQHKVIELDLLILDLDSQIEQVKNTKDILGMRLAATKTNQLFVQMEEDIARLEVDRANALGLFLPNSNEVMGLSSSINQLTNRYRTLLINNLQASRIENLSQLKLLKESCLEIEKNINQLDQAGQILLNLEQETTLAKELYERFATKLNEVQLQTMLRASSDSSISVMRSPLYATQPFWPQPIILFPLAALLGFFFGVLGAYISFYFEDTIIDPHDLDFTHTAVLGSLPNSQPA